MLIRFLIICALSLCIPLNADARLTFGTVPDAKSLIRTESQAHKLGAYLQGKLGEEVNVRVFDDETVLHDWLNRHQQVDFAILSNAYFDRQPRGEFFVVQGKNRRGQIVLRKGLALREHLRLEKTLALLETDPAARNILQPPPAPPKTAPAPPVKKPVATPQVDKKSTLPAGASTPPPPKKTELAPPVKKPVATPQVAPKTTSTAGAGTPAFPKKTEPGPSAQSMPPSAPVAAETSTKIWIDTPAPVSSSEKTVHKTALPAPSPKPLEPSQPPVPEIKDSNLTPLIILALTGTLAALALLRRSFRQKSEARVWPQDLLETSPPPKKTAEITPKSYFSAPSPVSRRSAAEPFYQPVEPDSISEDETSDSDDSPGKANLFLKISALEKTGLASATKPDPASCSKALPPARTSADDAFATDNLLPEEDEDIQDNITRNTAEADDSLVHQPSFHLNHLTDDLDDPSEPEISEAPLIFKQTEFEEPLSILEPAENAGSGEEDLPSAPSTHLAAAIDDLDEMAAAKDATEDTPFEQSPAEEPFSGLETAEEAASVEPPPLRSEPSDPLAAAIDDSDEMADAENLTEDNPSEKSPTEEPLSGFEQAEDASVEAEALQIEPSAPLAAAIEDLSEMADAEDLAEDNPSEQSTAEKSLSSLEPAEDASVENEAVQIEPSAPLAAAIDDLGEMADAEELTEDNPSEQSAAEEPLSSLEPAAPISPPSWPQEVIAGESQPTIAIPEQEITGQMVAGPIEASEPAPATTGKMDSAPSQPASFFDPTQAEPAFSGSTSCTQGVAFLDSVSPFDQPFPEGPLPEGCETEETTTFDEESLVSQPPEEEPAWAIDPPRTGAGTEDRHMPLESTSMREVENPFESLSETPPPAPSYPEEGIVPLDEVNPFEMPEAKEATSPVQQSPTAGSTEGGCFFAEENLDVASLGENISTSPAISEAGGESPLEEEAASTPESVQPEPKPLKSSTSGKSNKKGAEHSLRIKGVLSPGQVPALLKLISGQNQPGILTVSNSLGEKRIYFHKGKIATATSISPKADRDKSFLMNKLGYLLVRQGIISEEVRDHALEICARNPSKRLGETLIETCNLTREDLTNALRVQAEEVIYSLLLFSMGKFEFKPEKNPLSGQEDLEIEVSEILQGAARQAEDWKNIRKTIPSLGAVIAFESNGKLKLQHAKMTAAQNYVLSMIDGTRTVRDICNSATMLEIEVYKFLSLMVKAKILKLAA